MIRSILAALCLAAVSGTAWAGCGNYVDGSIEDPAPKAKICIAGFCQDTALVFECGNSSGAQYGYLNGLRVDFDAKGAATMSVNGFDVDPKRVSCSGSDDACFPAPAHK